MLRLVVLPVLLATLVVAVNAEEKPAGYDPSGNRLAYLNGPLDPYYPHRGFAKLTTPQWVGEPGVDCVVTLGIDDMRDTAKYEAYLRPILDRLKKIDGRAPVSIMTCSVKPDDPQLAAWLKEGLSIECHTIDHPCPCLQKSDFAAAKSTYDRCVDLMFQIPGNLPVAFRMPCCDSMNTPSPRFWQHAFNEKTPKGNYLQIDTSVFNVITGQDDQLPREIRFNEQGEERFRRYIPFPNFANTINDYPYPYVIGNLCWEFPCATPSDWSAQHVQKPNNPDTVRDWKYALDAAVLKKGTFNLVFHPHNWIRPEQVVELIDHAQEKYGKRVKFLTFRQCAERLEKNLLQGHPLRTLAGNDNGVRVLDVNNDGFMDVVVGNKSAKATYVWNPAEASFDRHVFVGDVKLTDAGILYGITGDARATTLLHVRESKYHKLRWEQPHWVSSPVGYSAEDRNFAVFEDIDSDGVSNLILHSAERDWFHTWTGTEGESSGGHWDLQERLRIDGPVLVTDVNADGKADLIASDTKRYSLYLFDTDKTGWSIKVFDVDRERPQEGIPVIPPFVRGDGTNNGVWQHSGKLFWQNEDTAALPDKVAQVSLADLKALADKAVKQKQDKERLEKQPPIEVGAAKVDITPDYPVRLSGYAARKSEHDGVDQPIFARAVAIGRDDPAVIVSVENCGVPASMVEAALKLVNEKEKLRRERLVVTSTHTHAAPWINGFAPLIFPYDLPPEERKHVDQYTEELTAKIAEAILEALKNRRPARLYTAMGSVDFAANRRTKDGPVDHRVPVLFAKPHEDGKPIAVLFNYACHNTTLGGDWNQISGDWSGHASRILEEELEGVVALSLIGCGADANPFPRGSNELAEQHGRAIASIVGDVLGARPIDHNLACKLTHVDLPWSNVPSQEDFEKLQGEAGIKGYHAKYFLQKLAAGEKIDEPLSYPIASWNFGDSLCLVFLAGEVVVDYSIALHDRYEPEKLWVTAYANDVPCYIPSQRILREGGYEAESSLLYYGRPSRLSTDVEEIILDAVQRLVPYQFNQAQRQLEFPPPKDPEEALKSMRLPPGFTIELVASEPLIVDPVAFDWSPDGSLWVVEMRDYPLGIDGKPAGRVKHLFDDDGDGRYDRAETFLDGLPYPTGVKVWRKGVLVSAAPEILYAEDTNGDGVADKRETLYRGFGEGNQQHRVNGLRWGLDGWLYVGNGDSGGEILSVKTGKKVAISGRDLRIRPDTGELEAQSGQTQYGRSCDDWGNWFGGNNSAPMWHYTLDDHYLRRNPHVPSPEVRKHVSINPGTAQIFPASKTLMRFNDFHTANRFTSACSPIIYRDKLLGDDFYGNSFVCEPVHNLVHRETVSPQGATFTSRRADSGQQSEFLASTDNWFRPSMVRTGPDGALWISDMYRFVIEHPTWIPQAWQKKLDLRAGEDKGRIFRVYREDAKPRKIENLAGFDTGELVAMLQSPNGWQRDIAQQMLLWDGHEAAVPLLRKILKESKLPTARVHAFCTLEGLGKLTEGDVIRGCFDDHPGVRRQAVRCAEAFVDKPDVLIALGGRTDDADPLVRVQLAYTLGATANAKAASLLAMMLYAHREDPIVTAAALSSVRDDTLGEVLAGVFAIGKEPPPAMEKLLAMASAVGDEKAINTAIARITSPTRQQGTRPDHKPELWQLRALASLLEAVQKNSKLKESISAESRQPLDAWAKPVQTIALEGDGETQLAAVRLVAAGIGGESERLDLLKSLLASQQKLETQAAAAQSLAKLGTEEAISVLLDGWSTKTPVLRSQTIDLLMATERGTKALLAAIEKETVLPPDIDLRRRQMLASHKNEEIRKLAAKLLADKIDADRQKVIDQYAAEINKLAGDAVRGKEVFKQKCSQCHKLEGVGHEIGPNLASLTDRSLPAMLTGVLDPNRAVEAKFVDHIVVTRDGRLQRGILANETSTSLTLMAAEGKQQTILRTDIEELRGTGISLMPVGMEKEVPPQAMADVLAYVSGFKPASKPFPGNNPSLVEVRDDASIRIPALAARIYGPSIVYEQKHGNLGYWSSAEDRAAWEFTPKAAGEYKVTIDFACAPDAAGNTLALSIAGQKLSFKVPATGSWDNYRGQEIGSVKLEKSPVELTITSDGPIKGALMDLRSVRLMPVK